MALAQPQTLLSRLAGIVGNEVIYLSEVETGVMEVRRSNRGVPVDELRCRVFQELLVSKLFVDQALIDSIEVTDDMVEADLNMQINDAIRTAGSEKALEDYFKEYDRDKKGYQESHGRKAGGSAGAGQYLF